MGGIRTSIRTTNLLLHTRQRGVLAHWFGRSLKRFILPGQPSSCFSLSQRISATRAFQRFSASRMSPVSHCSQADPYFNAKLGWVRILASSLTTRLTTIRSNRGYSTTTADLCTDDAATTAGVLPTDAAHAVPNSSANGPGSLDATTATDTTLSANATLGHA